MTRNAVILTRRTFVRSLFAASAVVALEACGGSSEAGPDAATTGDAPTGDALTGDAPDAPPGAPVWQTIPTLVFVQGVPSSISIAAFVSDPDGDPLTIMKNDIALPPGVTYDAEGQRFVYDGIGAAGSTSGHVLTADDHT